MTERSPDNGINSDQDDARLVELARRLIDDGHRDRAVLMERWLAETARTDIRAIVGGLREHPELVEPTARFIQDVGEILQRADFKEFQKGD